jgi:hypothetical protein
VYTLYLHLRSNHALDITQRHTLTTYNAAACLSRIADAEWLRVFEGVRRFSPTIGQLGEWRALCEGGWVGPVPLGLPDLGNTQQPHADPENERYPGDGEHKAPTFRNLEVKESSFEAAEQRFLRPRNVVPEHSNGLSLPRQSPSLSKPSQSRFPSSESVIQDQSTPAKSPSLDPSPTRPFADTNDGSLRSLSAFPSPPTHFPLPPPRQQQSSQSQSSQPSSSHLKPRLTESHLPGEDGERTEISLISPVPRHGSPSAQQKFQERYPMTDQTVAPASPVQVRAESSVSGGMESSYSPATSYSAVEASILPGGCEFHAPAHPRGEHLGNSDQHEFGVNPGHKPKARTMDNVKSDSMERSNTSGSNNSMVAAMRHRYSIAVRCSTENVPLDCLSSHFRLDQRLQFQKMFLDFHLGSVIWLVDINLLMGLHRVLDHPRLVNFLLCLRLNRLRPLRLVGQTLNKNVSCRAVMILSIRYRLRVQLLHFTTKLLDDKDKEMTGLQSWS